MGDKILDFLRDSAWNGIAGIVAIISLMIFFIDRKLFGIGIYRGVFINSLNYSVRVCIFVYYGLVVGIFFMTIGGLFADFIDIFADRQVYFRGAFGKLLYDISIINFIVWGFSHNIGILNRQLGAFGLYVGSMFGVVFMMYLGSTKGFKTDVIPAWFNEISFVILSFVLINVLLIIIYQLGW
jgi:hypothetical protein